MKNIKTLKNHLLTFANSKRSESVELVKKYRRPFFGALLNCGLVFGFSALPTIAQQMPNPFGGSGTSRLADAGANIMVIGTWLAFFIGLLSFVLIPIFIKFEWNYKKLLLSGITGLGGFVVLGSIAYDVVNLKGINMSDPTMGK